MRGPFEAWWPRCRDIVVSDSSAGVCQALKTGVVKDEDLAIGRHSGVDLQVASSGGKRFAQSVQTALVTGEATQSVGQQTSDRIDVLHVWCPRVSRGPAPGWTPRRETLARTVWASIVAASIVASGALSRGAGYGGRATRIDNSWDCDPADGGVGTAVWRHQGWPPRGAPRHAGLRPGGALRRPFSVEKPASMAHVGACGIRCSMRRAGDGVSVIASGSTARPSGSRHGSGRRGDGPVVCHSSIRAEPANLRSDRRRRIPHHAGRSCRVPGSQQDAARGRRAQHRAIDDDRSSRDSPSLRGNPDNRPCRDPPGAGCSRPGVARGHPACVGCGVRSGVGPVALLHERGDH